MIYRKDGGAKFMRPVLDRDAYLALRNGGSQVAFLGRIRQGEESLKSQLVQMNYSCLPNDDGSLTGWISTSWRPKGFRRKTGRHG